MCATLGCNCHTAAVRSVDVIKAKAWLENIGIFCRYKGKPNASVFRSSWNYRPTWRTQRLFDCNFLYRPKLCRSLSGKSVMKNMPMNSLIWKTNANTYYYIIRTFVNKDSKLLLRLYQSLVRPKLEYCVQAWRRISRRILMCSKRCKEEPLGLYLKIIIGHMKKDCES